MCEVNGGSLASIRSSEENSWIVNTFLLALNSSRYFCTIKTLLLIKRWRVILLLENEMFQFQINLPIKPFVHLQIVSEKHIFLSFYLIRIIPIISLSAFCGLWKDMSLRRSRLISIRLLKCVPTLLCSVHVFITVWLFFPFVFLMCGLHSNVTFEIFNGLKEAHWP